LRGAVWLASAIFAVNVPDIVSCVVSNGQEGYDVGAQFKISPSRYPYDGVMRTRKHLNDEDLDKKCLRFFRVKDHWAHYINFGCRSS
jgi:hypothetical protein